MLSSGSLEMSSLLVPIPRYTSSRCEIVFTKSVYIVFLHKLWLMPSVFFFFPHIICSARVSFLPPDQLSLRKVFFMFTMFIVYTQTILYSIPRLKMFVKCFHCTPGYIEIKVSLCKSFYSTIKYIMSQKIYICLDLLSLEKGVFNEVLV